MSQINWSLSFVNGIIIVGVVVIAIGILALYTKKSHWNYEFNLEYQYRHISFSGNCFNSSCYSLLYTKKIVFGLDNLTDRSTSENIFLNYDERTTECVWWLGTCSRKVRRNLEPKRLWFLLLPGLQNSRNNQERDGIFLSG